MGANQRYLDRRESRRGFLKKAAAGPALAFGLHAGAASSAAAAARVGRDYSISLAAWSLHRALFANLLQMIDLPAVCRRSFGIDGLELVNSFFPSPQAGYLKRFKARADEHGVKILLIMVDSEGALGHSDAAERKQALRNHYKWVDIAHQLGCHAIRVNMQLDDAEQAWQGGSFTPAALERLADSFSNLAGYGGQADISVIIENHGGVSSNADALVQVMKAVDSPYFGTLPDFGNFPEGVDKYESIRKMMPYAKAVSAKCHQFDLQGNEANIDYERMLQIVVDEAGYHGYIGIEFEGDKMTEYEGISACKRLLERLKA